MRWQARNNKRLIGIARKGAHPYRIFAKPKNRKITIQVAVNDDFSFYSYSYSRVGTSGTAACQ
jgi:hypothetical protein